LALDVRLPLEIRLGASNDVLNKRVVELAVRRRVESPRRAHQPTSAGEVGAQARGKCLLRLLHHRLVQADAAALVLAGLGVKPPGHQLRRALLRRSELHDVRARNSAHDQLHWLALLVAGRHGRVDGRAALGGAVQQVALLVVLSLPVQRRGCRNTGNRPCFGVSLVDVGQKVFEESLLVFRKNLLCAL
jgi:hypothetical protein